MTLRHLLIRCWDFISCYLKQPRTDHLIYSWTYDCFLLPRGQWQLLLNVYSAFVVKKINQIKDQRVIGEKRVILKTEKTETEASLIQQPGMSWKRNHWCTNKQTKDFGQGTQQQYIVLHRRTQKQQSVTSLTSPQGRGGTSSTEEMVQSAKRERIFSWA